MYPNQVVPFGTTGSFIAYHKAHGQDLDTVAHPMALSQSQIGMLEQLLNSSAAGLTEETSEIGKQVRSLIGLYMQPAGNIFVLQQVIRQAFLEVNREVQDRMMAETRRTQATKLGLPPHIVTLQEQLRILLVLLKKNLPQNLLRRLVSSDKDESPPPTCARDIVEDVIASPEVMWTRDFYLSLDRLSFEELARVQCWFGEMNMKQAAYIREIEKANDQLKERLIDQLKARKAKTPRIDLAVKSINLMENRGYYQNKCRLYEAERFEEAPKNSPPDHFYDSISSSCQESIERAEARATFEAEELMAKEKAYGSYPMDEWTPYSFGEAQDEAEEAWQDEFEFTDKPRLICRERPASATERKPARTTGKRKAKKNEFTDLYYQVPKKAGGKSRRAEKKPGATKKMQD